VASSGNHDKQRTRVFSSSNHAKYKTRTSWRTPQGHFRRGHMTFGHYRCCATSGCAHPRGPRKGSSDLRSHPVATLLLLLRKKGEKKAGHAQNLLPIMATSGQVLCQSRNFVTSGQKGGYGATSGCACAEHTSGQGT
jgi:hypothetical protein